jgi:DNA-binding transcriptional LysR family regulator
MPSAAVPFRVDTRLLTLFDALYRLQSVSRAAERLGVSQPTVSIGLGKLRRQWRDPLFVRTSTGMQPTARADSLIGPARDALELMQRLSGGQPAFDPAHADRDFRIAMTDASHITLLPRLLAHVRAAAPRVRLEVAPISEARHLLESGEADLALGFVRRLESGFHEQVLYEQDFVCLVSSRHPRIGASLAVRRFAEEAHVGVLSSSTYTMLADALRRHGIRRMVALELPGFLGLAAIVSSTDLVATVPRSIGETLARTEGVRVLPCPVRIAPFPIKQYWHARSHHDAAHRWLRGVCAQLFAQKGVSSRRR